MTMNLEIPHWERELVSLALEGIDTSGIHSRRELERGYAMAQEITRLNSKSFFLASGLLPRDKRRAARVLYAFCRQTDDIVDELNGDLHSLNAWRQRVIAPRPPADDLLLQAWSDVRERHRIPIAYVRQLLDGIGMDLTRKRYETFDELTRYCYGVASTVGLMAMHIIGFEDQAALPYAIKLGVALQLTNILRDVGEDFRQGRIYLPQEDLRRFGYTEADLANGVIDERFRALMDFEIARTRALYHEAWPGIRFLSPDGRLAIAAAADLYRGILGRIVQNGYDVFTQRASLSAPEKLSRLPGLWVQVQRMA
ncbi:MAG: phytoene/squalene synthase family protein [Anaerolineae bacterium]